MQIKFDSNFGSVNVARNNERKLKTCLKHDARLPNYIQESAGDGKRLISDVTEKKIRVFASNQSSNFKFVVNLNVNFM